LYPVTDSDQSKRGVSEQENNLIENFILCIYMKATRIYYTLQYKITIQLKNKKQVFQCTVRSFMVALGQYLLLLIQAHSVLLLTLVIFWQKNLGMLPFSLFLLLPVVQIYVSGHYIFRFTLSPPTSIPHHIDRFGDHLFSPEPGGWKRCLMPDSPSFTQSSCPLQQCRRGNPSLGSSSTLCAWLECSYTKSNLAWPCDTWYSK
jgi:hypothetical protein